MCGIAGLVSRNPQTLIVPMLDSIEHRGRDDEGVWVSDVIDDSGNAVCLGHRRLAIIDPTPAGHEPMLSPDGRFVLTFNGEIYNYRELTARLTAASCARSCARSDTSSKPIATPKCCSRRLRSGDGKV